MDKTSPLDKPASIGRISDIERVLRGIASMVWEVDGMQTRSAQLLEAAKEDLEKVTASLEAIKAKQ